MVDVPNSSSSTGLGNLGSQNAVSSSSASAAESVIDNQAASASDNWEPAESCEQCEVVLRIGVFFDGTNNNGHNITAARAAANPNERWPTEKVPLENNDESYKSDYTNVWKLHELYKQGTFTNKKTGELYICQKVYVEGVGTLSGKNDEMIGAGLDYGIASAIEKYKLGANKSYQRVKNYSNGKKIKRIELDIFGFSRGAATARHFANQIKKYSGVHTIKTKYEFGFQDTEVKNDVVSSIKEIETIIKFIGLFDTVATHGISRSSNKIPIQTSLPKDIAENKVYQLVAKDEHRENFSLISLRKNIPQGMLSKLETWSEGTFKEEIVSGVHSDIGGGYVDGEEENVTVDYGIGHRAEPYLQAAKKRDTDPDSLSLLYKKFDPTTGDTNVGEFESWKIVSKKTSVSNRIAKQNLKKMWEEAFSNNVPLNPIQNNDVVSITSSKYESKDVHHSANEDSIGMGAANRYQRIIHSN